MPDLACRFCSCLLLIKYAFPTLIKVVSVPIKQKVYIPGDAFPSQFTHPVKITGSSSAIVLSTAGNLSNLPAVQIPADSQGIGKGRTVQAFRLEGQVQKDRNEQLPPRSDD
jgi:hypothetical protein